MKRILTTLTILALAAPLAPPTVGAVESTPQASGTVKSTTDQPTETPSERIVRIANGQTRTMDLSDYNVNWQALSGGAGTGSSSSWVVSVTVGQQINGTAANADYTVSTGFWQQFGSGSCCLTRGDMDRSGWYSIADVTFLVDFLARDGESPGCVEEGDVDASGTLNIADLTLLVSFLFQNGVQPPAC